MPMARRCKAAAKVCCLLLCKKRGDQVADGTKV